MSTELTPVEMAIQELNRRDKARSGLLEFTKYTYPQYKVDPVHRLMCDYLDKVVSGEITRLMIFAPPQHGKSELVSVRLPAYWLGVHGNDPVALGSYGASLAESKGRQAREIITSPEYNKLYPTHRLNSSSKSVSDWVLDSPWRGGMRSVGVGGPLTGHGAGLGIIDDPFENWEKAASFTEREKVHNWYKTVFLTRIAEIGAIVFIMTRWHEDDLAGRLLRLEPDKWVVLRLPALAETQIERDENHKFLGLPVGLPDPLNREPGEPLSPSRFSKATLIERKSDGGLGSMLFAALYQQIPRAPKGNRIKKEWLPVIDAIPPVYPVFVRYWDKAGSEDDGACQTAGVLMVRGIDRRFFVLNVVTGRWTAYLREKTIKDVAESDRKQFGYNVLTYVEQEPGSGGKESAENTIQNLAGYRIYAHRPTGDKDVRLEPFIAQAESGNVALLKDIEWNDHYIEEMIAIPAGKYRDQGDASSGSLNKLMEQLRDSLPQPTVIAVKAKIASPTYDSNGIWNLLAKPIRRSKKR